MIDQQIEVADNAAELLALYTILPDALAPDSGPGGDGTGRHQSGGGGSRPTINTHVVDVIATIDAGLADVEAQCVRLLRLAARHRSPLSVIELLPAWHTALDGQPLARHLRRDLESWVRDARTAIGIRRPDHRLTKLCPDHRDTRPTFLVEVGPTGRLDRALIAGPPDTAAPHVHAGPTCRRRSIGRGCRHGSCTLILAGSERRILTDAGHASDWTRAPDGTPQWSPRDGRPALTWDDARPIRCPHCRTTWTSTSERRILARRLAALGDTPSDAAALL